jgi:hypothetical protein
MVGATVKRTTPAVIVAQAAPIIVAQSKQGASFSLKSEPDGLQTYIASSTGNKEFISSDPAGSVTTEDGGAFLSSTQVKIGYIAYSSGGAVGQNGSSSFTLGGTANPNDAGTLVIENGQFSASPGGSSVGRVYLGNGLSDAVGVVASDTAGWTATWKLTNVQLEKIADNSPIPIIVKVDGVSEIKDSNGGEEPVGTLTVMRGTTSLSTDPITSPLRRIPFDGKVCKVFNIPSPDGAADVLSLRITNDSDQPGTITGTLYNEAGEPLGEIVDLLNGHIDYTKNPPVERATLGLSDPLQLQPRETVILNSKNIAERFGQTSWAGERYVLEIQSTIQRIEVFNLLRNVENITLQPLSNVSTSAKNAECSPIP